jgi:hypothetical protein
VVDFDDLGFVVVDLLVFFGVVVLFFFTVGTGADLGSTFGC